MNPIADTTSGFTLVEVLVALAITSLAVITGLGVISDGLARLSNDQRAVARIDFARGQFMQSGTDAINGTFTERQPSSWTPFEPKVVSVQIGNETLETIVIVERKKP
jgi:prepilin-type N-terminal cleavage/methylation domain-containing protein